MREVVEPITTAEALFVEAHLLTGNFNKFEAESAGLWVEIDVWSMRQVTSDRYFEIFFSLADRWRITRYPDLEEDEPREPYTKQEQDNWMIDQEKVRKRIA